MAKSNYLENLILNAVVRGAAIPAITGYISLGLLTDEEAGTFTQTDAGGFARIATTTTNFGTASTTGTISNTATITFAQASSAATNGNPSHFAIYDALTAGNLLYVGALTAAFTYGLNVQPSFAAGTLTVTED